jgi:hypothetical protein
LQILSSKIIKKIIRIKIGKKFFDIIKRIKKEKEESKAGQESCIERDKLLNIRNYTGFIV